MTDETGKPITDTPLTPGSSQTSSTTTTTTESVGVAKPVRRMTDMALASSAPDESTLIMRMLKLLSKYDHWSARLIVIPLQAAIIMLFVFATKGTTAILALQPLILQRWQADTEMSVAERQVQSAQVRATQDVVGALAGVTDAVKGLSGEVASVRQDVNQLKQDRLADSRRLAAVSTQQAELQRKLEEPRR